MGLLMEVVEVSLCGRNIKWFENKGYEIPRSKNKYGKVQIKHGITILVKIKDLPKYSSVRVDIQCDGCGGVLTGILWNNYQKSVKNDGKYYCQKCASRLFGVKNIKKTKLKNSISFYDWCYVNLSKKETDYILSRWDYDLNIDKDGSKLNPKYVSYGSMGLDGKGYWFKCLDHTEHKSELKNIHGFTDVNQQRTINSFNCHQCNIIAITHPELVKYLVNKEDAYKYSIGVRKNILVKCLDCGQEKMIDIDKIITQGVGCSRCSDGKSYPSKFLFSLFEQINTNFITELSKKTFEWCDNFRYDFYIIDGIICETHGSQHYKQPSGNWGVLEDIQENDKNKEILARYNGVSNYIVVDCRESTLEWIKNNILKSELPELLNFIESDIDWLKCHEYACSSLVKEACNLWNSGTNKMEKIIKDLKVCRMTAREYLKQGAELGWCNYDPAEERRRVSSKNGKKNNIKIICLTTSEIFNSITEASNKYNIKGSSEIGKVCKGERNSAGKHPITGEKLVWEYYS